MIDTKELRRLAQAATPGPWKMVPVGDGRPKFAVADSEFISILTVTDEGDAPFGTVYDDADAEFIAAANPAAVIELLDRLEAAEKKRDVLKAKVAEMEQQKPIKYECRRKPRNDVTWGLWKQRFKSDTARWGSKTSYEDEHFSYEVRALYALPGAKGE